MKLRNQLFGACISLLLASGVGAAQDAEIASLQRNIDIFSGILEEALGLDNSSGLFGLSLGGIDSAYLLGQGVVFELRTPLANRRNRMSLASLNSAMQSLQNRRNPFEAIRTPTLAADPPPVLPLSYGRGQANIYYREMMERISNIDYSLVVSNALQQASDSARSLRSLGSVDENTYEQMRTELEELRVSMRTNLQQLREMEQEIRSADDGTNLEPVTEPAENGINSRLNALLVRIEPLRDQALAKAAELKQRTDAAEQAYGLRWQQDLQEFEADIYVAMCDYGSALRELPAQENISIILTGLGEESVEDTRRRNKLHILSKADVLQCQNGDIDAVTLQQRSAQYSY